jgi:hypothetical protein
MMSLWRTTAARCNDDELAELADAELVEQARLLAALPPALAVVVLPRLRLTLAELARRLAEQEGRP